MPRPSERSKEKEVVPTQVSTLEVTLATNPTNPDKATSSALCPAIATNVNLSAALYKKFMLLTNNLNRIKSRINLDKQVCREDPDYILMVSADEDEDFVLDLLSCEMGSYAPCSSPPSELHPTMHTIDHIS